MFKTTTLALAVMGTVNSNLKAQLFEQDISSNIESLVTRMPYSMQMVFIQNIENQVFQKMLKEISQVNLTPSQAVDLQEFIIKNKGALIRDTIVQKMTGFGGPSKRIWAELERIHPEVKNISPASKSEIQEKILPQVDSMLASSVFKQSQYSANLGLASTQSGMKADISVGAKLCFHDFIVKTVRVSDQCMQVKVGSITGVDVIDGKIHLRNRYRRYLDSYGLSASVKALSANYDANSGTFDFQIVNPGLIIERGSTSIKLSAPIGISHDGLYVGVDLSGAVRTTIRGTNLIGQVGVQAATDGLQGYGEVKATRRVGRGQLGLYLRGAYGNDRGPGGRISGNTLTFGVAGSL